MILDIRVENHVEERVAKRIYCKATNDAKGSYANWLSVRDKNSSLSRARIRSVSRLAFIFW